MRERANSSGQCFYIFFSFVSNLNDEKCQYRDTTGECMRQGLCSARSKSVLCVELRVYGKYCPQHESSNWNHIDYVFMQYSWWYEQFLLRFSMCVRLQSLAYITLIYAHLIQLTAFQVVLFYLLSDRIHHKHSNYDYYIAEVLCLNKKKWGKSRKIGLFCCVLGAHTEHYV